MNPRIFFSAVLLVATLATAAAQRIKVGIVQLAQSPTIVASRDRMVAQIKEAADRGARVVVLPEEALNGKGDDDPAIVDEAVAAIRRVAREKNVYVLFGGASVLRGKTSRTQWMRVIGPDGGEMLHYDKLYSVPTAKMPGVFEIDGVPCSTMICADRWLRGLEEVPIQQGAKVSFELSCNSWVEWVAPFGWYWEVPRAVRNNVWVVFANTGNAIAGTPNYPGATLRHGHSAIIAPDGQMVARSTDDAATIVIGEIDVSQATRAEAITRAEHPALREFWAAGVKRQRGEEIAVPAFTPLKSPAIEVTMAAAQVVGDVGAMEKKIRDAHARKADVIVFPARAASEADLPRLQAAAKANNIVVVFGAESGTGVSPVMDKTHGQHARATRRNSAFVIGPDGALLTRYDQLSAAKPYEQGTDATKMWFRVKGVPAVVTLGRDGLWSELAELAAAAGAQIHVHLDHDRDTRVAATSLRQQVWCNLASFLTFSATVNVVDSMIWDDLRSYEERRAPIGSKLAESGEVEVYSQYSANLVARAKSNDDLLVVTRRVNAANTYHTRTVARKNPQMDAWFRFGAASLLPK
jgi:predicted amidohydrolase